MKEGVIVELTAREHWALLRLSKAMSGLEWHAPVVADDWFISECDAGLEFEAILAWVEHRFRLDELQQLLDDMKKALGPDEDEEDGNEHRN